MEITGVDMKKVQSNNSKLLALATIQLDNQLVIHGLKLLQLENKRIVRFPNRKTEYNKLNDNKDGFYKTIGYSDIVHPCTQELREHIESVLFKLYDEQVNK